MVRGFRNEVMVLAKEIAVHVGVDGVTQNIYEPGILKIYQKRQGSWQMIRQQDFTLAQDKGLREMRKQVSEMIEGMGDCRIFVAATITGLPYYELEKAGYSVWEFNGKPEEFLDYILEKEEEIPMDSAEAAIVMPVPEDLGNGFYRISIKEIQENETGFTSKQILMPFIQKGQYYQLEIICNHIPPWLEAEIMMGHFVSDQEKIAHGEIRLVLRKKVCGE